MYCIKCGVKLDESQTHCPLCKLRVYHPDLLFEEGEPLYPKGRYPEKEKKTRFAQAVVTALFTLAAVVVLLSDLQYSNALTWSGYVIGALILLYLFAILPTWFKKPNPVVFVPCDFAAVGVYLLYINLVTNGGWFLSFAFPVVAIFGAIVTAVVTLTHYLKRGRLYVFGGACMALGVAAVLTEFFMNLTFKEMQFIGWSVYPLVTFLLIGGLLTFLAISRPARESMERKFFI